MWPFQPPGGGGYPPQVVAPPPSGIHRPAAADSDSDSTNDDDDSDGATMDGAPVGTRESAQAGAVVQRRPEPKTTRREEGPEPSGGDGSGPPTSVAIENEEPIKVGKQIHVEKPQSAAEDQQKEDPRE